MVSTALYWSSAVSRLISNCVTGSVREEPTSDEDKVVELPMLTASELKASGNSDEAGDKTIAPVVVDIP
ncbi:hypothetical protein CLAVI_000990 [Candidatus Clavichlamydia salmonicola]|uniref:hypothetical protein n=1 Tax=Candidatus Clavichlamydia salmonicola TaxID=469812 RepID=UPI001891A95F|nr:hypothetical protein [Candidatus Clavichlamydia salmonicola]MBF5051347.1 hypothetical protein [Candidatus Clavichlamydia salmonicola]